MGDALRKVQAGQKLTIPANAYNAFVDAAVDFKRRSTSNTREPDTAFRDRDVILVRNDSGEPRERFDILGIDRPIFAPEDNLEEFKNRPSLVGMTPQSPKHIGKFVVLQEPLAPGAIGRAVVDAVTVCRVVMTNASVDRVDIAPGECGHLRSDPDGSALVLWKESGTGTKWAVVRLGLPCCVESPSGSESFSDDDSGDSDDSESSATGSLSGSDASGSSVPSGSQGSGPSDDDGSDDSGSGSGPSTSGSGSGDLSASGSGPTIDGSGSSGSGSSGSSGSEFPCGGCYCGYYWTGDEWVEAPTQCGTEACPETAECPPMMPPFFEPREEDDRCFGMACPAGTGGL
jgi:hypothetical protein